MNLPLELGTSLNHYFLWCIFYYENTELLIYYPLRTHPEIIECAIKEEESFKLYEEAMNKWNIKQDKYENDLKEWEKKKEGLKPVLTYEENFPKPNDHLPPHRYYRAFKRNNNQLEEIPIKDFDSIRKPNSFEVKTEIGTFKIVDPDHYAKYNNKLIKYKIVDRPQE